MDVWCDCSETESLRTRSQGRYHAAQLRIHPSEGVRSSRPPRIQNPASAAIVNEEMAFDGSRWRTQCCSSNALHAAGAFTRKLEQIFCPLTCATVAGDLMPIPSKAGCPWPCCRAIGKATPVSSPSCPPHGHGQCRLHVALPRAGGGPHRVWRAAIAGLCWTAVEGRQRAWQLSAVGKLPCAACSPCWPTRASPLRCCMPPFLTLTPRFSPPPQMRNMQTQISRDADIVVAAMVSIVGSTLIFQGWRLDPLLLLCQVRTKRRTIGELRIPLTPRQGKGWSPDPLLLCSLAR